jgi:hypothetical protein
MKAEVKAALAEEHEDIAQGRRGETGIPHSDQWLESPKPRDGKMWKKNRKNILRDNNGRAVPTGILEEMYQAVECRTTTLQNIHQSYYYGGRYYFKLPSSWSQPTLNKRISVRRIDTPAKDYFIPIVITVNIFDSTGAFQATATQTLYPTVPSNYSIQECLGAIMALSRKTGWGVVQQAQGLLIDAIYQDFTVTISPRLPGHQGSLDLQISGVDFWKLLNVDPITFVTPFAPSHEFKNVWDRKTLFLHASFVTDTTAGYLGRGGEFYPKPNKMYRTAGPDFFIETSLDGYHPVPLPYENWILELSGILDADDYQSP